jgi:hypothetical protein
MHGPMFYARLPQVKGTAGGVAFLLDEVMPASPAYRWTLSHTMPGIGRMGVPTDLAIFPPGNSQPWGRATGVRVEGRAGRGMSTLSYRRHRFPPEIIGYADGSRRELTIPRKGPRVCRLTGGGRWIRTIGGEFRLVCSLPSAPEARLFKSKNSG